MDDFQAERITRCFNTICQSIFNHYGSCNDCDSKICCTAYAPAIHRHEIDSIAKHINMKPKKFKRKFVINLNLPMNKYALQKPCPLLTSNIGKCMVYSHRPVACWRYPFQILISSEISLVFIEGIELCPVATLIAEEFKEYYERISRPNLETSKEYEDAVSNAMEKTMSRIGDAWKNSDIEMVESEFLATNVISFFIFYLMKIKKMDEATAQKLTNEFNKNTDAFLSFLFNQDLKI